MYTWLYDEEKRYESWMINFKDFVEKGSFEKLEESERNRRTMPVKGTKTLKEESMKKSNEIGENSHPNCKDCPSSLILKGYKIKHYFYYIFCFNNFININCIFI
jgi:hypothetical protein